MKLSENYYEKIAGTFNKDTVNLDGILLQLEVTNACNHACYFCPNHTSKRPTKMMDYSFAKRIISECSDFLGKNKKICFHMNGEPLLYKQLPELVKYSKEQGYDYCFITTNGSTASDELLTRLFEAGLDSIKFSINAGSSETYKMIHGKDDYKKAMHALQFSAQYRKKNKKDFNIFVSCVGTKDNYTELEELNNSVKDYCDEAVFYYPCGYAGQIRSAQSLRQDLSNLNIKTFEIKHTCPCKVLWNSINVTCEGYLSLCCSESENRLIIEDLNKTDVKSAWFGPKMNFIRQKHINSDIIDTPCYSCITNNKYDESNINKDLFGLSLNVRANYNRIKKEVESIDYESTQKFFNHRAEKFNDSNPYSVTMYQDNNPELVKERNAIEINILKPFLKLDHNSKVLDIACGIGRWSDAIQEEIKEYCGIDFSPELIKIASERNSGLKNRFFEVGTANNVEKVLFNNMKGKYNVILLIGILMYLNENDLFDTLQQIERIADKHSVICIREPIGLDERLTLKNFYSNELKDNYSAIYRTKSELMSLFNKTLLSNGYKITEEGFLFKNENLNNRKETEQYYFILRR